MASDSEILIDAKRVAAMYGIAEKTVWHWLAAGKIPRPHVRRERYTRWLARDVLADIEAMSVAEVAEATT